MFVLFKQISPGNYVHFRNYESDIYGARLLLNDIAILNHWDLLEEDEHNLYDKCWSQIFSKRYFKNKNILVINVLGEYNGCGNS